MSELTPGESIGSNGRVTALVDILMNIEPNPYGSMWRSVAEEIAQRILTSDWMADVVTHAQAEERARIARTIEAYREKGLRPGVHSEHWTHVERIEFRALTAAARLAREDAQ